MLRKYPLPKIISKKLPAIEITDSEKGLNDYNQELLQGLFPVPFHGRLFCSSLASEKKNEYILK